MYGISYFDEINRLMSDKLKMWRWRAQGLCVTAINEYKVTASQALFDLRH